MSLHVVRQVNAQHPHLLQQNINRTCYQFVVLAIAALRAAGHQAYHVCKSPGEGQYTPPGFQARDVIGLDGKTYSCSGVSHDAIWSDGQQYDIVAGGNDSDRTIYKRQGDPNWSFDPADGPQIVGAPDWSAVPPHDWRANNPPLKDGAAPPVTQPPPQATQPPGREEALDELNALDAYYKAHEGLQRPSGLSLQGRPDFEGISAWYLDVYQRERMAMKSRAESRAAYVAQIRRSSEWQQKHPGETP